MSPAGWELVLALGAGLGLAAACGLRVFAPMFVLGLAAHLGHFTLAPSFAWLGTTPALIALGAATVLEVAAYYVPWLDHALDVVATPAAVIAGAVVMLAAAGGLPPWLRWSVALIAGGGLAGLTQGASVLLRLKSTALTGGVANPAVSSFEWTGAIVLAVIAVVLPLVALAIAVGLAFVAYRLARRLVFGRRPRPAAPAGG